MTTCIKDKAHSLEEEAPAVEEALTTSRKWREDDVKRVATTSRSEHGYHSKPTNRRPVNRHTIDRHRRVHPDTAASCGQPVPVHFIGCVSSTRSVSRHTCREIFFWMRKMKIQRSETSDKGDSWNTYNPTNFKSQKFQINQQF